MTVRLSEPMCSVTQKHDSQITAYSLPNEYGAVVAKTKVIFDDRIEYINNVNQKNNWDKWIYKQNKEVAERFNDAINNFLKKLEISPELEKWIPSTLWMGAWNRLKSEITLSSFRQVIDKAKSLEGLQKTKVLQVVCRLCLSQDISFGDLKGAKDAAFLIEDPNVRNLILREIIEITEINHDGSDSDFNILCECAGKLPQDLKNKAFERLALYATLFSPQVSELLKDGEIFSKAEKALSKTTDQTIKDDVSWYISKRYVDQKRKTHALRIANIIDNSGKKAAILKLINEM